MFNFEGQSLDALIHPQTSAGSNLDSALICSAGWNKDTVYIFIDR